MRSLVFLIVCVDFQSLVLVVGHNHCVVFIVIIDFTDVIHKHALVDVITFVFEVDENFVVGKDAHAVDLVSVYGFSELGETAVFVDHVSRSVEATIMREE